MIKENKRFDKVNNQLSNQLFSIKVSKQNMKKDF